MQGRFCLSCCTGRLNVFVLSLAHCCFVSIQKFDAKIIIEGAHIGEAKTYAEKLVEKNGLTYVNGYDDPPIIAGAGTIGMEVRWNSVSLFWFLVWLWTQRDFRLMLGI